MENSNLSLIYPSMLGINYSDSDLKILKEHRESPANAVFDLLSEGLKSQLSKYKWQTLWARALEFQIKTKTQYVSLFCEDYPKQFLAFQRPPPMISYMGSPIWKDRTLISVVGSRKPLNESLRWMSLHLTPTLKAAQLYVVSGGARGVDQWAHQLSLQVERPTICVLPSGLNAIYPDSLVHLSDEIVSKGGCLLSAYTVDQRMRKYFFIERNQLIAALGAYCLIVEAGEKSGSLVTSREAIEMDRLVMTLPFSPWCGAGVGSNRLIAEDLAQMVTSDQQIIEAIFKSHWI